jgi:transposase-like protein
MTYTRFLQLFPDHDACLDYLKAKFYSDGTECPSCHRPSKFHRIKGRSAYSCQHCGHQVYPTAGTIFHKSTVSLQLWFWAIFLLSSTRCGISAKQLEREIGVTYKTAHRMFKQIRTLLAEDDGPLSGEVEADETFVGGKPRATDVRPRAEIMADKVPVFAAVERGGRVRTQIIPNTGGGTLTKAVRRFVLPEAVLFTDDYKGYNRVGKEYQAHHRIRHSAAIYVKGNVHTQTIEGFFGLFKNGLRGVYHSVSKEYLQSYLNEYTFRYNRRDGKEPIFWAILDRVEKKGLTPAS